MSFQIVELASVAPTPWANGGGTTRELLAWPDAREWSVRLSVAEVTQAGPFSRLPGVRRWFCVLEGDGVLLRVQGAPPCELTRESVPFEFDGGAQTECDLVGGPTRDFNLMLRRGSAKMARVHGSHELNCKSGTLVAVYARQGAALRCEDEDVTIPPDALAWRILDSQSRLQITSGDALWMEIQP
jgi:uncharacterized protein